MPNAPRNNQLHLGSIFGAGTLLSVLALLVIAALFAVRRRSRRSAN